MSSDNNYMELCLQLAAKGRYTAAPNPMVGSIVVKDQEIVGQGFHQTPGTAHAEILALKAAGSKAKGATLYVNLEPCCHHGRTPPCIPEIIKAGISKVVVAMEDPNPKVQGRGLQALKNAGIEIVPGILTAAAEALNRAFCHYITRKTPYVIAKWAMSLDGQMRTDNPKERQLTGIQAQQDVHELRQCTQAILIGARTAKLDNPALTVRLAQEPIRQPQRIILNTNANLSPALKLFTGELPGKTWLICAETALKQAQAAFDPKFTELIPLPLNDANRIDLQALLTLLGQREIMSILLEGGPTLLKAFFASTCIQEVISYITPWLIDDLAHKQKIATLHPEILGADIKISSLIPYKE